MLDVSKYDRRIGKIYFTAENKVMDADRVIANLQKVAAGFAEQQTGRLTRAICPGRNKTDG